MTTMFENSKPFHSEVPQQALPKAIEMELWNMIFLRPQKGIALTSPQRFNFFRDPVNHTLSVVHSQREPYFSDNVTAPFAEELAQIKFPARIYVFDTGQELIMTDKSSL